MHLPRAHAYWKERIEAGDTLIDATCGNGKDTCVLAQLAQGRCKIYSLDIQQEALDKAEAYLSVELTLEEKSQITFLRQSHVSFPLTPPPKLIVYNLGYLPGGDKSLTTQTETTLLSVQSALSLLCVGGALSVTCYPGHPEGAKEESALLSLAQSLPSHLWNICYHTWINRPRSPTLFFIERR